MRRALGASAGSVRTLVLRQGLLLAGVGLILGVGGASGLSRVIATLLYSVNATDPVTCAGVALLLAAVAKLACLPPGE